MPHRIAAPCSMASNRADMSRLGQLSAPVHGVKIVRLALLVLASCGLAKTNRSTNGASPISIHQLTALTQLASFEGMLAYSM
jgi:hypothetical protein